MSSYVNCLGGRCPHMPFFIGGQMSGGENVLHSFSTENIEFRKSCTHIRSQLILIHTVFHRGYRI